MLFPQDCNSVVTHLLSVHEIWASVSSAQKEVLTANDYFHFYLKTTAGKLVNLQEQRIRGLTGIRPWHQQRHGVAVSLTFEKQGELGSSRP